MIKNKKIGFFGDSFCSSRYSDHFETYITKLEKYYNSDVINLGYSGSSIWDILINQYPKITESPNIVIFVWTEHSRLFHRVHRKINLYSVLEKKGKLDKEISIAAEKYYQYFYDEGKSALEYKSALYYFDREILSKISKETKILHFWSFGNQPIKESYIDSDRFEYLHDWSNGMELRPPLIKFGLLDFDWKTYCQQSEFCSNHIFGNERNALVFEFIKYAIENYESGKKLNFNDLKIASKKI